LQSSSYKTYSKIWKSRRYIIIKKLNNMEKIAIRQMEYVPGKGEINNSPSETIEGQSLTINEILIKFTQGTLPNIGLDNYYDTDQNEDIDFDSYDPTLDPAFDLADATQLQYEAMQRKQQEEYDKLKPPKEGDDKTNFSASDEIIESE
ncbi:MAG: hypothetical protein QXT80_02585, partial [Thermoplasmatales archaeon]